MSRKEKKGCCLFKILKFFVIALAALAVLVLVAGSPDNNETTTTTNIQNTITAPTVSATPEPSTREEWVLASAKKVYEDNLISVEWQEVDNQKDMIVIKCVFSDNFTKQMRRDMFMLRAKDMFKHISELGKDGHIEYSSCYIIGRTTYLDKYNNEFEGNAMEIRLLEKDLSKLNWDNYMNNETIINLATTYTVHPLFRD